LLPGLFSHPFPHSLTNFKLLFFGLGFLNSTFSEKGLTSKIPIVLCILICDYFQLQKRQPDEEEGSTTTTAEHEGPSSSTVTPLASPTSTEHFFPEQEVCTEKSIEYSFI
jgi:hypothetical protein